MKINNGLLSLIVLFISMLLISGCTMTSSIEDVKNPDYVGETVAVSGTVENTIKIGDVSGYTVKDTTGSINVASETLPQEGAKIRVTGTLTKDTLLGYYIKAD